MGVTDWEPRALPSEARCQRWYEQGGRLLVSWTSGVVTTLEPVDGAFCAPSNIVHVRPWKDNNPATWSDFYADTHPPIPEGWEACFGGWHEFVADHDVTFGTSGVIRFWDDFTLQDRRLHAAGDRSWSVEVRRILPAIPAGWEAVGEWEHRADGDTVMFGSTTDGEMLLHESGGIGALRPLAGWFRRVRRVPPPADWGDVPRGVELRPGHGLGGAHNEVVINGAHVGRVFDKTDGVYHTHAPNHEPVAGSPFASLPAAIVALTGRRE